MTRPKGWREWQRLLMDPEAVDASGDLARWAAFDLISKQITNEEAEHVLAMLDLFVDQPGSNPDVEKLRGILLKRSILEAMLRDLEGARAATFKVVPGRGVEAVMVHPTPRPDAQGRYQLTYFSTYGGEFGPGGHMYAKAGASFQDAVREAWREHGPFEAILERANPPDAWDAARGTMAEYMAARTSWRNLALPRSLERIARGQNTGRAAELRAAFADYVAGALAQRFVQEIEEAVQVDPSPPPDVDAFYSGLDDDLRALRGELTAANRGLLADLDLVSPDPQNNPPSWALSLEPLVGPMLITNPGGPRVRLRDHVRGPHLRGLLRPADVVVAVSVAGQRRPVRHGLRS